MMFISIVIVTYKSISIINNCLQSIQHFSDLPLSEIEVLIVDNSNGKDAQLMENFVLRSDFNFKITFIKNTNKGYGHGNNIGIKHSNGKIVCIMNPDVILTQPLFKDAAEKFSKDKSLAMLGYKQKGGYDLSYYFRQEFYVPFIFPMLTKLFNKINFFTNRFMYLSGALLFIEKKTFEEAGLFDENIFLYYEEPDITQRLLLMGKDIQFDKTKSYLHDINERSVSHGKAFAAEMQSAVYYLKKYNYSPRSFLQKLKVETIAKKMIYSLLRRNDVSEKLQDQLHRIEHFLQLLKRKTV